MSITAVTFDFHNTLAICDEWFELEVRTLVPRLLDWLAERGDLTVTRALHDEAQRIYRAFRLEIIQHGEEVDAVGGVLYVLKRLGLDVALASVEEGTHALMHAALADCRPVDGVIDSVRHLADAGLRLGVVSNAVYHPFLEWSLAKFGIADEFQSVVTSARAGYYKSRPEVYQLALHELDARPEHAVHIGDSYRFDVEGARRAGMRTVWYQVSDTEGAGAAADLTVSSLVGLAPTLLDHFSCERDE